MKRSEYIRAVAEKGEFTIKGVKEVLKTMEEVAYEKVKDEDVTIFNGLTLSTIKIKSYVCPHPQTGEPMTVPEQRRPRVKVGARYKHAVAL